MVAEVDKLDLTCVIHLVVWKKRKTPCSSPHENNSSTIFVTGMSAISSPEIEIYNHIKMIILDIDSAILTHVV